MTGEIFSTESFLWSCLWQSTIFLVAGLLVSFLFRRHSARAHRVLFLAMIAAVIVPAASTLVNHYELGLFVAEPALIQPPTENRAIHEATGFISNEAIERSPNPIKEDSHSAMTASGEAKFPWAVALLYVWIAASLILALRLLVTFVLGAHLLGRSQPLDCDKIKQAIHMDKMKLGISRDVKIYSSAKIHSPVIWCWKRRPVLLVPSTAGQFDHGIDWAGVLCHELAHWKRRDHIAGLLAELTVCFLPWHLLLWWAKSRLISLSEQACDDWVVASGQPSTDYAESLLNLTPEGQMAFVPAVVSSKRGLADRVRRILKDSCANPRTGTAWALAACIVATCLTVGIAFAQTRPAKLKSTIDREEKSTTSLHHVANGSLIKVTGLVKDPEGRPISGTSVTLFQTKLEYVTDAEGKFVAALAPSDKMRYFFAVHKQRKLVATGRLAGGKRHLEIKMVPARMVSGRVVDPNGRPVSGAQVAPLPMTSLYVLTDSEGRFDVGWSPKWHAPDHELCLMARHVELNLAAVADISPEDKTINIKLEPALALHGTIEDTDGQPIVGAVVGLSLIRDWGAGTPVKDVVTNYQGRFELPALPQRQEYGVGAKAEGYWRNGITTGVINRVMQVEEVGSIILKKPILSVSGIVLDGSGKPVEGIPVYWRGDGQPPLDSQTDAQGKFTFEKVCQGPAKISAKNETLFGTVETQGGAKDVRLVVGPRFGPGTAEEIESARQRIISFPEDRSMGKVFVRDAGSDSWYEGWQELAEAKGDVSVAAGKEVKLQISEQAAGDLSALDKLGTDDLQMLSFGWKAVRVGSLAPIGNLKGLKALNIQSAKFDSEDFKHLTGLTQLEVLRFGDYQLTDESMKYIGQLTSLRSLALWGTGISDEGLRHLQDLTNLTFLALNSCKITDDGLDYLKNMTALEGLQIYQTEITDMGLMNLQRFSQLKHIKLDGNGITDRGLKHLENLTSLENIWIDSNPITDEGLSYFAGMKKLKELYASDTKITDAGLVNLRGMKDFNHLLIDGIGDEGIRHLSELPALEFLQIQDAQITKASIPDFKRMNSLSKVLLSGDKVDDDLLDALRAALPNCKIWDPQRSRDYPMATWRQRFEAVYRLEDDQILKRISPPFIPERRDYYLNEHSSQAKNISRSPDRFTFHWTGKLKNWGLAFATTDLKSTLRGILRLKSYEFEGPRELLDLNLPGDWIVRDQAPVAAKLAALQEVLANELDRKIRFEKRTVEHEVIVATGRFSFHPLAEARKQDTVHLYVDELSMSGGGTDDSVAELLQTIGNRANTYVVDRTESAEETSIFYYLHRSSRPLRQMESSPEKTEKLKVFLANLTKQTELQFELGSQPVEVWFVTEENEEKR